VSFFIYKILIFKTPLPVFMHSSATSDSSWALEHVSSRRVHGEPLVSMAVSPDGCALAFGSGEGHIVLADAASLAVRTRVSRHSFFVPAVAFSRDGVLVASVSADATLKVGPVATTSWRPGPVAMLVLAAAALAAAFALQLHRGEDGNT
jgi:WD40 repeat protein